MIVELYILYVMSGLLTGSYVFYKSFKNEKSPEKGEIEMVNLQKV